MKKLKIIVLILIVVTISSIFGTVYADEASGNFSALGIMPNSVSENNMGDMVTKADFIFMVAHLIQTTNVEPAVTRFKDVDGTNIYSGYIELLASLGIINGDDNGLFNPDGSVEINMAYKILVSILGYNEIAKLEGGYPNGYISVALKLGLHKGVSIKEGYLTNSGALAMINNTLDAEVVGLNYSVVNGEYSIDLQNGDKQTILSRLGISVYLGFIEKVNQASHSVTFKVEKNKYDSNKVELQKGEEVNLEASDNINISHFENVLAIIWVNKAEKIICIEPQSGVEVKYGYISSINGDSDGNSVYGVEYIKNLTILDDKTKYDVKSGVELEYNDKISLEPAKLIDNFAKMVLVKNEIAYIQSWDLVEGGLITKISSRDITYIKGEQETAKLKDVKLYKNILVFIDGRSADIKELKTNSVFHYYASNDSLIIIASEKIIVDVFKGFNNDELEIGNAFYNKKDVYYSTDGVKYKKNADFEALFDVKVMAYIGADGNVLFVKPLTGEVSNQSKFFGIVNAYDKDNLDEKSALIELWLIKPEIKKQQFNINSKTKFKDGITLEGLFATSRSLNGTGLYEFEVNRSGRITSVSKPTPFFGYGGEVKANITTFTDDATPYLLINDKPLYFQDTPITAVYEQNGEFKVKNVKWFDLYGRPSGGVTMTFYGEDECSDPSVILLYGNLESISSKGLYHGIMMKKTQFIEADEMYYKLIVIGSSGTVQYKVTKEIGENIPKNAFISYCYKLQFSDVDIDITSVLDLSKPCDEWVTQAGTRGLNKGVVKKIDSKRLYLESEIGTIAYFMHPDYNYFAEINDENKNNRFKQISVSDISVGDTVFYNLYGNETRGIFVVR